MGFFRKLFGLEKREAELIDAIQRGSYIIDVRTPVEYKEGHIQQAVNIPLEYLSDHVDKIKKIDKPVITTCQNGVRSRRAKNRLRRKGVEDVYNGGGWIHLREMIKIVSQGK
jgi:rhodanese-related sulfurtransferase